MSNYVSSCCPHHQDALDFWAQNFVSTMLDCASNCFPTITSTSARRLVGWKDSAGRLKESARFWYKVWKVAGCPVSGVLFKIKKNAKTRYKYEVRRLKHRQDNLLLLNSSLGMIRKSQRSVVSIILHRDRYLVWMVFLVVRVLPTYLPQFEGVLNRNPNALQTSFYSTLQSSVTDTLVARWCIFQKNML